MAIKDIPYKNITISLSYDLINPSATKTILILHGWGSNKEIMKQAFAKKMPSLKHIYLDMAGFGKSSNSLILTTQDYALITKLFLESLNLKPDIAVGHSFGGKVATLLETPFLVLLSSSGVLVPKPFKIKAKIALFKFFKSFGVSQALKRVFVSDDAKDMPQNMYETFKNVVNEDFEKSFENSKSTALLFWGKSDTATPLWTAEKITKLIKKSTLYPLDGDHYFFLKHADFIGNEIETKTQG